nr:asparagine synthase-related protein [uncultured Draconibacterium sp.]
MGFICGIINLDDKAVSLEEITYLAKATGYQGFILNAKKEESVAVGYCHHPDRKPKAGIYSDADVLVVADIRIYNGEKLKQYFDFVSPEEAFAKAYRQWGALCANHINGDFAVVVVDKKKKEVCLLRDHIGTRPLVYWKSEEKLIFTSHEFGLVKSGFVPVSLSERKVIDRHFRYDTLYTETSFRNVYKVIPGHYVSYSNSRNCTSKPFWEPGKIKKDKTLTFDDAVVGLRKRIVSATVNRMEPGKTGMHISGGIDSCGIASIVADHTLDKKSLTGYSWSPETFEDPVDGANEKEFIEAFRDDKKVTVKYLRPPKYEPAKDTILPEFETMPIEHPVMQMAEKDNIETFFSGWGGDEFVSLSLRGTVNHLFFSFKWLSLLKYARVKGIKATILKFRTDVLPLCIPFGLLPVYKAGKTDRSILRFLRFSFIKKHWKQIFLHKETNPFGYGNRTRFALNLLESHHLPERMESWAINAERYGFEYKYPLLDKEVLDFWFSLPAEYTYKNFQPRLLYREAMKDILTEKIRIRKGKEEPLRIACSLRDLQNSKEYLGKLFYSLPAGEHLPFFKPEAFKKVFDQPISKDRLKNVRNWRQYTLYLRYVALVKKYGSFQSAEENS